ncbi:metacaspase-9-like isoform X1 [Coffea arabica]|uniref:Metacaspase-9-like isoform X1 n=1 Tax=Coffea arabica TaxID=13443 RepID=A0A6P6WZR1_COFAR|nr:metacaspase-9-like isoform X1 [Coffea arabica]XP_027120171.1 metacaspase-9-like isoform X1 [Coffea arabica]
MGRYALLVGCCYLGDRDELQGCYNDVDAMQGLLINRFGFHPNDVIVLTDMPNSPLKPTGAVIKYQLCQMIKRAMAGDVVLFYFSGHGTHQDFWEGPYCKRLEAIVPSDFNLIYSADFRYMVNNMPQGADFVMIADSCNSGGLIDQSKEQVGPGFRPDVCYRTRSYNYGNIGGGRRAKRMPIESVLRHLRPLSHVDSSDIRTLLRDIYGNQASILFRRHVDPDARVDRGILISGCQSNETAVDDDGKHRRPYGLFTDELCSTLRNLRRPMMSNAELVETIRDNLRNKDQHPCLYCSDRHADAPFLWVR